jgi:hypothetical protein
VSMMDGPQIVAALDAAFDNDRVTEVAITLDPVLPEVVVVEGTLGLAKRCMKTLFRFVLHRIHELRQFDCNESVSRDLQSITRAVLLVKGDFPIAFALRRKAIINKLWDAGIDIQLISVVLSLHPKCPSGWQHRRWCINSRKPDLQLNSSEIETEKELCRMMAEKHPKNYYAWLHRLWILPLMSQYQVTLVQ